MKKNGVRTFGCVRGHPKHADPSSRGLEARGGLNYYSSEHFTLINLWYLEVPDLEHRVLVPPHNLDTDMTDEPEAKRQKLPVPSGMKLEQVLMNDVDMKSSFVLAINKETGWSTTCVHNCFVFPHV